MIRRRSFGLIVWDTIDIIGHYGFKLGGLTLLLFVGYLLFGVLSGGLAGLKGLSKPDQLRIFQNVVLACKVIGVVGIFFTFGVVVRFHKEEYTGYLLAIFGFVFYFGAPQLPSMPDMLTFMKSAAATQFDTQSQTVAVVLNQFRLLGLTFLIPGVFLTIRDMLDKVRGLWSKKPDAKLVWGIETKNRKVPIYGCCWDFVFCREFIRDFCPAYEAGKPCWKVRCGCYCDEKTILQALKYEGGSGHFDKEAAYNSGGASKGKLSAKQKTERCRKCMIFLEHERQKYQLLCPVVMVGVVVLMWSIYPIIKTNFGLMLTSVDKFVQNISFISESAIKTKPSMLISGDGNNIIFLLFIAWLSIVVMSYALRTLEYFVFKLRI